MHVVAALILVAAACGDDSDSSSGGDPAASFQVVTYNAGLAQGFVDHTEVRAPAVTEALSELTADVVAVQEVWTPEDVTALTDGVADTHPHSFFLEPQPEPTEEEGAEQAGGQKTGPPCPADEAIPLEDCARANCGDVADDQLSDCVLASCGTEFAATCPECQTCLAANIGGSLDEILAACAEGTGGGSYAYGGAFGIGILSAEPFVEQDSLILESSLNRRGVLYVQIEDPVLGAVDIFNTHLSANLDLGESPVPFPGEGSWAEEQAAQIEVLNDWVTDHSSSDAVTILLGDMNTSPDGDRYSAETPDNYELFATDGWVDPYVEASDAECTYCDSNLLVGGEGDSGPMLDHILVKNFDGEVAVDRIFTDPVQIEVEGETVETHLSDHYALLATLTPD